MTFFFSFLLAVPPRFESKFISVTAVKGEPCVLRCISVGDLPLTFTWQKDKQALDLQLDRRLTHHTLKANRTVWSTVGGSELRIEKTARHDSALYTCEANNDYGTDDTNIQLIVQGKLQS